MTQLLPFDKSTHPLRKHKKFSDFKKSQCVKWTVGKETRRISMLTWNYCTEYDVMHSYAVPVKWYILSLYFQCWETLVGQEIYRLVIMDFIFTLGATFCLEFLRRYLQLKPKLNWHVQIFISLMKPDILLRYIT